MVSPPLALSHVYELLYFVVYVFLNAKLNKYIIVRRTDIIRVFCDYSQGVHPLVKVKFNDFSKFKALELGKIFENGPEIIHFIQ